MIMFEFIKKWDCNGCREWAVQRKKGYLKFSFEIGILKWGGWMFSLFVLFQLSSLDTYDLYSISKILLLNFVLWSISGFVYGYLIFYFTDRAFFNHCKKIIKRR